MNITRRFPALIGLLFSLAIGPSTAAEGTTSLGRLFLTPEWRAHLERQRQFNIQEAPSFEGDSMRLDGVVVRSSGKSTVWVNHHPQSENARDTGIGVATSLRQPGSVRLTAGTEPAADLKVGVTLNRATHDTESGLADGAIRINKSAARK